MVILPALWPLISTSKYTLGFSERLREFAAIELGETFDCVADGHHIRYEPYPAANKPPIKAAFLPAIVQTEETLATKK